MLMEELKSRKLPSLKSREELVEIMQREVYGYLPDCEFSYTVSEPKVLDIRFDKGNAHFSVVDMTITTIHGSHTFPVYRLLHQDGKKRPLIILNNIHPITSSFYFPTEELSEFDVDCISIAYKEVSSDDGDFSNGLAPVLLPNGQDTDTTCGKIGIWAWAAMRVLDYALTLPSTDEKNVAILGHSRLGKTALYTGMMDTRFKYVFSNCAGSGGDALAHGSLGIKHDPDTLEWGDPDKGENIKVLTRSFPYWFCKNYLKYAEKSYSDDFDQHFILASIAPRYLAVASASLDYWADPESQQLCCLAASEAWENQGLTGLIGSDHILEPKESLLEGHIGYFKIDHKHFLSRHCWHNYIKFIELHKNEI